jgi:hypothetical protein
MTTPPQNPMAFLDQNNPLVATGPARLDLGIISHPQTGQLGGVTMRTQSGTLTAFLTADEVGQWVDLLNGLKEALGGGSKLVPASMGDVAAMNGTLEKLHPSR